MKVSSKEIKEGIIEAFLIWAESHPITFEGAIEAGVEKAFKGIELEFLIESILKNKI